MTTHDTRKRQAYKSRRGNRTCNPSKRAAADPALDRLATGIGNRTVYVKAIKTLVYPIFLCHSKFTFQSYPHVTLEFAAVQVNTATRMYITCVIICARCWVLLDRKEHRKCASRFGFHASTRILNLTHESRTTVGESVGMPKGFSDLYVRIAVIIIDV